LSHGVTEFTAGLEYHNQAGALNESMSDVLGSLVKQWARSETTDQADWLIGGDIFSPDIQGDALRSLKSPGNAYDNPILGKDPQPAHMESFVQLPDTEDGDWGGVHINSGIPNHAFYLLATSIGGRAWEAPGHIWYEALKASGPRTDFQEFADRTYQAAGWLYGTASAQQKAVQEAWLEVGLRINVIKARKEPAKAPAAQGKKESDSLAALQKQLAAMAQELKNLSRDVASLKKSQLPAGSSASPSEPVHHS
jgi:Zn-dependent metalloprotease